MMVRAAYPGNIPKFSFVLCFCPKHSQLRPIFETLFRKKLKAGGVSHGEIMLKTPATKLGENKVLNGI